jgi:hypothetical protein
MDTTSLLAWVSLETKVSEFEANAQASQLTLGPCAYWNKDRTFREVIHTRSGWRLNPVLVRVEEVVAAFEYRHHGQTYRTLSTPREACGPEMRTLLYGDVSALTAVQVRLLPRSEEHWLKVTGKDPGDAHSYLRSLVREGVAMRSVWSELSSTWLSFTGAMGEALKTIAEEVAAASGLQAQPSPAPRGRDIVPGFLPLTRTWETLGPRDAIVLADPWAVLVMP